MSNGIDGQCCGLRGIALVVGEDTPNGAVGLLVLLHLHHLHLCVSGIELDAGLPPTTERTEERREGHFLPACGRRRVFHTTKTIRHLYVTQNVIRSRDFIGILWRSKNPTITIHY